MTMQQTMVMMTNGLNVWHASVRMSRVVCTTLTRLTAVMSDESPSMATILPMRVGVIECSVRGTTTCVTTAAQGSVSVWEVLHRLELMFLTLLCRALEMAVELPRFSASMSVVNTDTPNFASRGAVKQVTKSSMTSGTLWKIEAQKLSSSCSG